MKNNPQFLIIHHSNGIVDDPSYDTSGQSFEAIDSWHKQRWPNFKSSLGFWCGYHYVILKDGGIRQARIEFEEGAHCVGMNKSSIGICIVGNFDRLPQLPNSRPTEAQEKSLKGLLKNLCERHRIPTENIVPHRHFAVYQNCYGKNLSDNWAKSLLAKPDIEIAKEEKLSLLQKILELLKQVFILKIRLQNILGNVFGKSYE